MMSKFSVTGVPLAVIGTCAEALEAKNAGRSAAQSSAGRLFLRIFVIVVLGG